MCGRFSRDMTWQQVHAFSQGLDLILPEEAIEPSYNVAPTQQSWVLIAADAEAATAAKMRWGLLPSWARDTKLGASMINARVETVATKPAFRSAWKTRRCLVPASGYYEWRIEEGVKQPYWIHDARGPVLMFAGLWENWKAPAGEWLQTFTIITQAAAGAMLELHDRTPLMLKPPVLGKWLHGSVADAEAIAASAQPPALAWHAVSRAVGNPRSNGPMLVEPISRHGTR
jgi:putative SOS response-associated peptidase YedK